jgi:hypothetical protein
VVVVVEPQTQTITVKVKQVAQAAAAVTTPLLDKAMVVLLLHLGRVTLAALS